MLLKGQWVEVDREKLHEAIAHWDGLQRQAEEGELSFLEGIAFARRRIDGSPPRGADGRRAPLVHVTPGDAMREILAGLRQPGTLDAVELGGALRGELRPYQREGVSWLRLLTKLGLGACLAG